MKFCKECVLTKHLCMWRNFWNIYAYISYTDVVFKAISQNKAIFLPMYLSRFLSYVFYLSIVSHISCTRPFLSILCFTSCSPYLSLFRHSMSLSHSLWPYLPSPSPSPPPSSPPSTGWTLPGQRERENLLGHFIHFSIGLLPLSLPVCWICFGFVFDGLRDLDRIRDTDPDTGVWEKIQIRIRIQI